MPPQTPPTQKGTTAMAAEIPIIPTGSTVNYLGSDVEVIFGNEPDGFFSDLPFHLLTIAWKSSKGHNGFIDVHVDSVRFIKSPTV